VSVLPSVAGTNLPRGVRVYFILLSHSEPFHSRVSEFLNRQQSYRFLTGGFCFDPQPQHLLSLVKCSVVFPPETLCDHTLKLATIYYFTFPLHDPLLRYRAEDSTKFYTGSLISNARA